MAHNPHKVSSGFLITKIKVASIISAAEALYYCQSLNLSFIMGAHQNVALLPFHMQKNVVQ
jgi:hypothetical protein